MYDTVDTYVFVNTSNNRVVCNNNLTQYKIGESKLIEIKYYKKQLM